MTGKAEQGHVATVARVKSDIVKYSGVSVLAQVVDKCAGPLLRSTQAVAKVRLSPQTRGWSIARHSPATATTATWLWTQGRSSKVPVAPTVELWRLRRLRRSFLILENLCFVNAPATKLVLSDTSCGRGAGLVATIVKLLSALHKVVCGLHV